MRLYVKRVFITDDAEGLAPSWLRFLRGIVDSEDLPLNVSREMLQNNPLLAKIRAGVVKRVLADLAKTAGEDPEGYGKFWETFGAGAEGRPLRGPGRAPRALLAAGALPLRRRSRAGPRWPTTSRA